MLRGHWNIDGDCDYIMLSHTPRIGITIWFSYQHSNLMQISFWSHPDANLGIATKFCTCHDSCAVVACVKICSVLITRCWELKTRINFSSDLNCGHQIFSVMPLLIYESMAWCLEVDLCQTRNETTFFMMSEMICDITINLSQGTNSTWHRYVYLWSI